MDFFPLDEQLGVRDAHWSEQVAADAVWLYGQVTGEVAAQALKRLAGLDLSAASLWRRVERWGTQLQAYETVQQATASALPLRGDAPPSALRLPYKMGVGMDGTMVHIRKEGWKELKVGDVFEIAVRNGSKKASASKTAPMPSTIVMWRTWVVRKGLDAPCGAKRCGGGCRKRTTVW